MSGRVIKLAGHPVHPVLGPAPFGLLVLATAFDTLAAVRALPSLTELSFWAVVLGASTGLVTAGFALLDWTFYSRIGQRSSCGLGGFVSLMVVALFAAVAILRWNTATHAPTALAFAMEVAGASLLGTRAWLGHEVTSWIDGGE
jgi:uncharacterized membrane protein